MGYIIALLIAGGLACIPASMAKNKGYSFAAFWCLSFFLSFLIGIIVAACLVDKNEYIRRDEVAHMYGMNEYDRHCNNCGVNMHREDQYCPKCGASQYRAPEQYSPSASSDKAYNISDMQMVNDYIVCPECETAQRSNRNICYKCGAKFIREDL